MLMLSTEENWISEKDMRERISPIFYGTVKDRRIIFDTETFKRRFDERLRQLEGKKITLSLTRYTKRRSLNQNNYYWGAIIPMIADQVGMLDEDVHDALRMMFLKDHSKKLPTIKSTAELSKGEFVEYLIDIENWATSFLEIEKWPDPEEWEIANI